MQTLEESYQQFLDSRKTEATRRFYLRALNQITEREPLKFLEYAAKDKSGAESRVIKWVLAHKGEIAGSSIVAYLAVLRSLTDFSEVPINWRKIKGIVPSSKPLRDRPPLIEEIRKIYDSGDLRLKTAVSFFVSTGARLGAIDGLKIGDVEILKEIGIAAVKIYAGSSEEYFSFLNEEALTDYHNYLEFRERSGEKITPKSPVFRSAFNPNTDSVRTVEASTSQAIKYLIERAWWAAGLKKREFHQVHGFRKYFKTVLTDNSPLKSVQIERLMGHGSQKVENRYYKPEVLKLAKLYAESQKALFISEGRTAKLRVRELEEEKEITIKTLNSRVHELELGIAEISRIRKEEIQTARLKELKKP